MKRPCGRAEIGRKRGAERRFGRSSRGRRIQQEPSRIMSDDTGSAENCLARYHELRTERPDCFREPADSLITILTDVDEIAAAQREEAARRERSLQLAP